MRTDSSPTIRLDSYQPYPFRIEAARLEFALDPDETRVRTRMSVVRRGEGPLVLDGVALDLRAITIDDMPLEETAYKLGEDTLTIDDVPDGFELETEVVIEPRANTALSGLYISGGRFCTQCEAHGFRRITYWPDRPDVMSRFSVRIEADAARFPILLSNGTPGERGSLAHGRHFAEWEDPHPKPSYLFALCAGDYDVARDTFTTRSGRVVRLAIHVDKGAAPRAAYAMDALKRAMAWDEDKFAREYDLGEFNIVAVRDFNFGAMENKGLNIFNSAYVLADEQTATDDDFEAIESIVAHEYFHNWTGNRITCRDWFQLCLKEGLTVFRDQEFSADMRSAPVQRIKEVIRLRARQFPEDAGPLAHAVRPDTYGSVDNLYTATVYEKGAELIRMLKTLIGDDAFAKGMDRYFETHDGTAATIEDFYACFETASGRDLTAFRRWYAQAGTPRVRVEESWDAERGCLTLHFSQSTPPTPGQPDKAPVIIPLRAALLDGEGGHLEASGWPGGERLIGLDTSQQDISIELGPDAPRPLVSLNRGLSAPVQVHRNLSKTTQRRLARAETDPLNRWDAFRNLISDDLIAMAYDGAQGPDREMVSELAGAVGDMAARDPALAALIGRVPVVSDLFLERRPACPASLAGARERFRAALGEALAGEIEAWLAKPAPTPFRPDAEQAGIRALRALMMDLHGARGPQGAERLEELAGKATSMTEALAALRALSGLDAPARTRALNAFRARWEDHPLVMDKWFSVQAAKTDLAGMRDLVDDHAFDLSNPNRVRAVLGVFANQNLAVFHASDGSGHRLLADFAIQADKRNPALAARLLSAFEHWRRLEAGARQSAQAQLERLAEAGLSSNAADIVARSLADPTQ